MNRITYGFINCLLLLALDTNLNGQTYSTEQAGKWNDSKTWEEGAVPPTTVSNGVTININHGFANKPVILGGPSNPTKLIIESGGTVSLMITDDTNPVYFSTYADITVQSGGTLTSNVSHISLYNNSKITNSGIIDLTGCFSIFGGDLVNTATGAMKGAGGIRVRNGNIDYTEGIWNYDVYWCIEGSGTSTAPEIQRNCEPNVGVPYGCAAVLPVELSYFGAVATPTGVLLNWRTESEIGNLGFILERKTADSEWTEIVSYLTDDASEGQKFNRICYRL